MTLPACSFFRRLLTVILLCLFTPPARAAAPHWIRLNSGHFSVVTDAEEKKGREAVARFEQMRSEFAQLLMRDRVNFSEPMDIIALASDDEYVRVAPIRQGHPINDVGFLLPGEDRNFVVLNLAQSDSWRAVSYQFAQLFLNYNYPPTQPWFDEGFAEYFSSMRLDDKQVHIGGAARGAGPFVDLLNKTSWLPIADLFQRKAASGSSNTKDPLFAAQSWVVMHFLLNKNKLPETGMYFDLVENQKLSVEQATQKAYGMTTVQFEQAVKDYFHALASALQAPNAVAPVGDAYNFATPIVPDEIGTSVQWIEPADAQALLNEMVIRMPEHREQGVQALESIVAQPKTDSAIARRALGWAHMEKNEFDDANDELNKAVDLDAKDAWPHYYLALARYRESRFTGRPVHGLANIMVDLRVMLDWKPEFAEAYNLLGLARLEGGGNTSAMEAMRAAIRLSPRNETYRFNMAQVYIAAKQWDAAVALLERLKGSQDAAIASAARGKLEDLPTLRKYGLLPQREPPAAPATASQPPESHPAPATEKSEAAEQGAVTDQPAPLPVPDKRPIQFLKGKLIAVDCSQAPAAVLMVSAGARTLKLRTPDYKALTLIGADDFSCAWTNRAVTVNYKPTANAGGDLVSLEIR